MSLKKYIDNYVDTIYSNMKTYKKKQQSKRLVNKKKAVTFKTKKVNKTKHNKSKSKRKGNTKRGGMVLGRKCQTINLLSNNAKVALNNILLALRGETKYEKTGDNEYVTFIQSSNEGSDIYEVGEKVGKKVGNTKQAPIGFGNALGAFTGLAYGGKMIRFSWGFDKSLRNKPVDKIISAYEEAVDYLLNGEGFNNCIRNFICPDSQCDSEEISIPISITLNIQNSIGNHNDRIIDINKKLEDFVKNVKKIEPITTQNTNEQQNTSVDNCKYNPLIQKKYKYMGEYEWKIPISNTETRTDVNNLIDIQKYLLTKAKEKKGFGNLYRDPDIETNYVAVIGRLENPNYFSIETDLKHEKGFRIFDDYNKAWKCVKE